MPSRRLGWLLSLSLFYAAASQAEVQFNRDIRPILSDRCFACHGPDAGNRKAGLRLDIEAAAKAELRQGRVPIVPGQPDQSELFRRITTEKKALRMPPAYAGHDALSPQQIALIRQWIEQGASWQAHWSFLPPQRPALPEVKDQRWPRNPIDRFVLARLEREGMHPSPEAEKARLLRRVTLDLTGLLPAPGELDAYLKDQSPGAYERVVDRLLASPRYAERMAIRWLEAARYADTNGYQSDGPRDMWRWRDWVINAFHRNMPFDQFTVEQIAGDLLPNATLDQRIATGFHRNHRTSAEGGIVDEEFRVEYVADRTETTSAVWLGLTVGCARCHDHKYDPLPQRDYYRLFAFFNNVPEKGFVYNFGNEEPYIKAPLPEQQKQLDVFDTKIAALQKQLTDLAPQQEAAQHRWEKRLRKTSAEWELTEGLVLRKTLDEGEKGLQGEAPVVAGRMGQARSFDGKQFLDAGQSPRKFDYRDPFTFAAWVKPESPKGAILSRTEDYWEGTGHGLYLVDGKLRLHVIFRWTDLGMRVETEQPVRLHDWQHVLVTYDGSMKAAGVHMYVDGKPQPLKILFDQCLWPIGSKEPFRIGAGGGLRFQGLIDDVRVYDRALSPEEAAVVALTTPLAELAAVPPAQRTPAQTDKLRMSFLEQAAPTSVAQLRAELAREQAERKKFYDTIPTVMVMAERPTPRDTFVLKRGAYDAHGEKVSSGVPGVLPALPADTPKNRLALARWIVDRNNPLTARVIANRFWAMLFGTGLVKTVEDFGSQGEWPLHPELLDWLAVEFMDSGWDVKRLLKTIVTSATYRQSSRVTPELLQRDSENRLLARGPRLRLAPEMIRDQALAVSGLLVEKVGGPSVKPYQPPGLWKELQGGQEYVADKGEGLYRRSLYTYWRRTVAPPGMVTFDSPNRETCTVRETRTNTPLQALTLMNDVPYVEASRKFAERLLHEGGATDAERINYGYRLALAREPQTAERDVLLAALAKFREAYRRDGDSAAKLLTVGDSAYDASLPKTELAAFAGVASLLLNLDEMVTKE